MTSEKAELVEQRLDALITDGGDVLFGPWTAFSPLSSGWTVRSGYTGTWVRRGPGNTAMISVSANTDGTHAADGSTVGTIPSADADGNNLRPPQSQSVPVYCDQLRIAAGSNNQGARLLIATDGTVTCYGVAAGATFIAVGCGWYSLDSL